MRRGSKCSSHKLTWNFSQFHLSNFHCSFSNPPGLFCTRVSRKMFQQLFNIGRVLWPGGSPTWKANCRLCRKYADARNITHAIENEPPPPAPLDIDIVEISETAIDSNSSNTGVGGTEGRSGWISSRDHGIPCPRATRPPNRQITWTTAANSPTNFVKIFRIVSRDRFVVGTYRKQSLINYSANRL